MDATDAGKWNFGELSLTRMGFGTMRLPGPGAWGPPVDHAEASAVLRRAVELGVDHIDTSDFYGPHVANDLLAEALRPYPAHLTIATKIGVRRGDDRGWYPDQEPERLRAQVHENLRRLGLDQLDLVYLRVGGDGVMPPSDVDLADQLAVLAALRDDGLVGHVGLSGVTVDQLRRAESLLPIAAVQNRFNLLDRSGADLVPACTERGIAFVPYYPLAAGDSLRSPALHAVVTRTGATPHQVALAWLLALSPVVLPIPGTCSTAHLEENVASSSIELTGEEVAALSASAPDSYSVMEFLMSQAASS